MFAARASTQSQVAPCKQPTIGSLLTNRSCCRDATGHIKPHGGSLINLLAPKEQHAELIASATHKQECSERNACDVELLTVGGFSPLTGFMNKDVYDNVVDNMR